MSDKFLNLEGLKTLVEKFKEKFAEKPAMDFLLEKIGIHNMRLNVCETKIGTAAYRINNYIPVICNKLPRLGDASTNNPNRNYYLTTIHKCETVSKSEDYSFLPQNHDISNHFRIEDAEMASYMSGKYEFPRTSISVSVPDSDSDLVKSWINSNSSSELQLPSDTLVRRMTNAVIGSIEQYYRDAAHEGLFSRPCRIGCAFRMLDGSHVQASIPTTIFSSMQSPLMIIRNISYAQNTLFTITEIINKPKKVFLKIPNFFKRPEYKNIITHFDIFATDQYSMQIDKGQVDGIYTELYSNEEVKCWSYNRLDEESIRSNIEQDSNFRLIASIPYEEVIAASEIQIPIDDKSLELFNKFESYDPKYTYNPEGRNFLSISVVAPPSLKKFLGSNYSSIGPNDYHLDVYGILDMKGISRAESQLVSVKSEGLAINGLGLDNRGVTLKKDVNYKPQLFESIILSVEAIASSDRCSSFKLDKGVVNAKVYGGYIHWIVNTPCSPIWNFQKIAKPDKWLVRMVVKNWASLCHSNKQPFDLSSFGIGRKYKLMVQKRKTVKKIREDGTFYKKHIWSNATATDDCCGVYRCRIIEVKGGFPSGRRFYFKKDNCSDWVYFSRTQHLNKTKMLMFNILG